MTAFGVHLSDSIDRQRVAWNARPDPGARLLTVEPLTDGRAGWRLSGEIDIANRAHFTGLLAMVTAEECGTDGVIHLDLAELTFIDPTSTRELVHAAQHLYDTTAGRLALQNPPYSLRRVAGLLLERPHVDAFHTLLLPSV